MNKARQSGSRKKAASEKKSVEKKNTSVKRTTEESGEGIWAEVRLVALLIVSVLLFFSNFGFGGKVGGAMSSFLFGIVGIFAYLFPVVMLLLLLFSLANRENLIAAVKIAGAVLGCLASVALLHLVTMGKSDATGFQEIYRYCSEYKTGGGLLGGLLSGLLKEAFGTVGAYLVLIGILIICIVIVTERSFVKGMSRGSKKVYESARQDMERRREEAVVQKRQRRSRKEERKKEQRLERKVSGVSSDLLIPKRPASGVLEIGAEEPVLSPEPEEEASFPIHKPAPKRQKEEPPREELLASGDAEEISFSEEDLDRKSVV